MARETRFLKWRGREKTSITAYPRPRGQLGPITDTRAGAKPGREAAVVIATTREPESGRSL